MSLQEYREFIASKAISFRPDGIAPSAVNASLKAHQVAAVEFSLSNSKSAIFLDTGLGKSLCELEWARQVCEETGKPSLILTPLAVAGQMVREGQKFGIEARQIREQEDVGAGIMVANYERLSKLDPSSFGGIVLDESSILKSFAGQTRNRLMDAFGHTHFRLAATATPSPNDHTELGNHAEFLGVMRIQEMLSKWFINDTSTASQEWRLKGHAVEDFWSWVASWSRCATLPSDLGGDDTGYVLPEIDRRMHVVKADRSQDAQGALFRMPEMSATSFHAEKRLTLEDRCARAASLATHDRPVTVWCETNDESAALARMIPDAVEVHGSMTADEKERRLLGFVDGDFRAIVTKPKLAGFGVNWQHCAPGDTKAAMQIARAWFEDLRREGLCDHVPDDELLAALASESQFDVMHWQRLASPVWMSVQQGNVLRNFRKAKGQNDEKHVCPLQLDVIRKCLRLYTRPGDVVMDPFNGIGSTGYEAVKSRRKYLGFELKAEYAYQASLNLQDAQQSCSDLFSGAVL